MQILIIDNNINPPSWGSADLCKVLQCFPGVTIHVRRAPQEDLPQSPKNYDRIIVSGSKTSALDQSPWVEKLIAWIQAALELKKPYLGVCFGHQILARALGGRTVVAQSSTPEFGWTQIQTIQKNELFQDLPNSFCSFSAHFEEVIHLPEDCISFAKSKDCQIQAFQLKHTSVYGIQFHPEKAFEEAQKILNEMKNNSSFVSGMRHMRPKNIFLQKTGELIFRNFLKMDKKN